MDIRQIFFKNRSYTPIPIALMIIYFAGTAGATFSSIGVILLFINVRKVWRGDYDTGKRGFFTWQKGRYEIVETLGLYWHFVDLVWVFIFAFFYLW